MKWTRRRTDHEERERAITLIHGAIKLVEELEAASPLDEALAATAQAKEILDSALNELMAAAVLEGQSLRSVAEQAGVAPNSVATRIAKSAGMSEYSTGGRVRAGEVFKARADKEAPMTFTQRKPTS